MGGSKKTPRHLRGSRKGLRGSHSPRGDPPHNGGESNDMRGSPRGSQNLEISSGSPPEWGGVLRGVYFRTGLIQIDQKISSRVARKKTYRNISVYPQKFKKTSRFAREFIKITLKCSEFPSRFAKPFVAYFKGKLSVCNVFS